VSHTGCAVNGYENRFAWCETFEPCLFREYWDYCDTKDSTAVDIGIDDRNFVELSLWPSARSGHSIARTRLRGKAAGLCGMTHSPVLVMFGGNTTNGVTNEIYVLCPMSNQVSLLVGSTFTLFPKNLMNKLQNQISQLIVGICEYFVKSFISSIFQWTTVSTRRAPPARTLAAMTAHGEDIFIFGGMNGNRKRFNDLWKCNLGQGECVEIRTTGFTPYHRRGMTLTLEAPRSCPSDCS
jgi:hypothetical protein